MTILLLSAYNTPSHKYWSNLLIEKLPSYTWTLLTLPPRKFSWRIRGNPLSWYSSRKETLKKSYDVVLATSMVDLSTLIGIFPNLGASKKILYFHENQFDFPLSKEKINTNVESMMVNLYGALCADKVVFNSNYNRDSFETGSKQLLKRVNDLSPTSVIDDILKKSEIIPVPICNPITETHKKIKHSIIWNHRWEYDKNPIDFYKALKILKSEDIDFKLIMMGIQFKNSPKAFDLIKTEFKEHILCWGEQNKQEYKEWLLKGEYIISTAIHEFQGLAVMEGVQYGAIPIVPNRLSYPQWFSKDYIYDNSPQKLAELIKDNFINKRNKTKLTNLTWTNLKISYINLLEN